MANRCKEMSAYLVIVKKKAHLNVISEQNPLKTNYTFAKKNKIIYSKRRLDTRIYCQSAKGSSKRCFGRPFAAKARIESNTFQPPKTQIYLWILTQILSLGWCVRKSQIELKSDNLQYDMLGCWVDGSIVILTKNQSIFNIIRWVAGLMGQTKEIQIILRLFLVIAMYCQASSSQFFFNHSTSTAAQ